jgi:hypothetical protein
VNKLASLTLLLSVWATLDASAQVVKKPKQQKIAVSTHVDRTAIWVGDILRYTVKVLHDPDIEFVLENLQKENLNLAPFVVRDVSVRQDSFGSNKKITEVSLFLTTYETGQAELRIPSLTLYHFARSAGLHKPAETPAESFSVPPMKIGFRSTLTADNFRLRDRKEFLEVKPQTWIISFVLGVSGITFLALDAGRRFWASAPNEKPQRQHLTRRARTKMFRDFVEKTQTIGRSSVEDQVRFYSEVSQFVREYLSRWLEIDASSLTPEEIEIVLKNLGREKLGAAAKTILERCERVLYTPQGTELGKQWRDEVQRDLGALAERRLARGAR